MINLPPTFCKPWKESRRPPGKSWAEIWEEVVGIQPLAPLLSNLRIIRISNAVDDLLIPVVGINGEKLTQINMKYQHNRFLRIFRKLLEQLGETPKLEYLSFRNGMKSLPARLITQSPLKNLRLELSVEQELKWYMHNKRKENGLVGYTSNRHPVQLAILQKDKLESLTLGLTSHWSTPEYEAATHGMKYLPELKKLWLDLSTFKCDPQSGWSYDGGSTPNPHKHPPSVFLKGLANPSLTLLYIKFPLLANDTIFHDFLATAKESCNLQTLKDLSLTTRTWVERSKVSCAQPPPEPYIRHHKLLRGIENLLPLPNLTSLRVTVAPNLLSTFDLTTYAILAEGLPCLQKLDLGATYDQEMPPLYHLAAFCSMFPQLEKVTVGALDGNNLASEPRRSEWTSFGVKTLRIGRWVGKDGSYCVGLSESVLMRCLGLYFPNSDLVARGPPGVYSFVRI